MGNSKPRLFIGVKISLDPQNINQVEKLQSNLSNCNIKWVPFSNYHLTLKFLGETPVHHINNIKIILEEIANKTSTFKVSIAGLGFLGKTKPKVIWIGIDAENSLFKIQKSIDNRLEQLGFEKEDRSFCPHLTIGRIKHLANIESFREILQAQSPNFSQSILITDLILYESHLSQNGPVYIGKEKIKLII